jgi:hypothetical protein
MKRSARFIFGKVGILALVLVAVLGVTGVVYAKWSDSVNVTGTMGTYTFNDTLGVSLCWTDPPGQSGTGVACWGVINNSVKQPDPDQMVIVVSKARKDVYYYCDFYIENDGTIPTRVQSIDISNASPAILDVQVLGIGLGDYIEPGSNISGSVLARLKGDAGAGLDYQISVRVLVEQWQLYHSP